MVEWLIGQSRDGAVCQLLFVFVIDIKTVNCNDCFLKLLPLAREPLHVAAFHLTAAGNAEQEMVLELGS